MMKATSDDDERAIVVVLDPFRPMSVPIEALTALSGPVEIAEDVPAQIRIRFTDSFSGARVLVTTDLECEAARTRLQLGARLITSEPVKGDALVAATALMDRMWSFGGWEVAQTHESLSRYLLEETYEVLDAILAGDSEALNEELGDLLLQVLFHARIAECGPTAGTVDIDTIARALVAKLCHRSPHLSGEPSESVDIAAQERAWDQRKAEEKLRASELDGIAQSQPAVMLAEQYVKRAVRGGFPEDLVPVELSEAVARSLEADEALRREAQRFAEHFRAAESMLRAAASEPVKVRGEESSARSTAGWADAWRSRRFN
ncbi:MazG family protein [Rhodococcus sp. NPDC060176]|uniref:MazG family protein n=1 Tax=Rhodococcus sp. NPDC060176 TaxID=3347062 RepID=UPI00364B31AB